MLAASSRSAGKTYGQVMESRWAMTEGIRKILKIVVKDAVADMKSIADSVDFVFARWI